MAYYVIYHAIHPTFQVPASPVDRAAFERVADITADSPQEAYGLSQNVHQSWTNFPYVAHLYTKGPVRSTSVGDVIGVPNGNTFVVAPVGFIPVQTTGDWL